MGRSWQEAFNPFALRTSKTPWSFGRSECKRVNHLKQSLSRKRLLTVSFEASMTDSLDRKQKLVDLFLPCHLKL